MLARGVAMLPEQLQTAAIGDLESDGDFGSHASSPLGISSVIQMSYTIRWWQPSLAINVTMRPLV